MRQYKCKVCGGIFDQEGRGHLRIACPEHFKQVHSQDVLRAKHNCRNDSKPQVYYEATIAIPDAVVRTEYKPHGINHVKDTAGRIYKQVEKDVARFHTKKEAIRWLILRLREEVNDCKAKVNDAELALSKSIVLLKNGFWNDR